MDEYGEEMMGAAGDPAAMDFDVMGKPVEEEITPSSKFQADGSGTKIDYSNVPPIPFQKTATLVNYFITNTA